ncbi:MAG: hypothetical protein JWN84_3392 [Nocardioides sp.]|jgi:hypothetical protein|nr:hypothetical protein [Nocardioides sp.]
MPSSVRSESRCCAGEQRGAAAIEAGLIVAFFLMPLLMGVLVYGDYFWRAQRVGEYVERAPIDGITGRYETCGQLVDKVKSTLSAILAANLSNEPIALENIAVSIVELLPSVGAVVEVSIRTGVTTALGELVPLPNGGSVASELTFRLDDVVVTTTSCA